MVVRGRGERDYPAGSDGKEPFCTAGDQVPSLGQEDLLEKEMTTQSRICISERRTWQPTLVFLPGESHGQRSLAGYTVHGVAKSQTQMSN